MMKNKIIPSIVLTIAVTLLNTGCLKTSDNGVIESGTRTNILLGLVDYKNDYTRNGSVEQYVFEEKPIESEAYTALRSVTSFSLDRDYEEEGKKLSILWGLFSFRK